MKKTKGKHYPQYLAASKKYRDPKKYSHMSRRAQDLALYQKRLPANRFERALLWYSDNSLNTAQRDILIFLPAFLPIFDLVASVVPYSFLVAMTLNVSTCFFAFKRANALQERLRFIRESPPKSITRIWLESLRSPLLVILGNWGLSELLQYL